MKIRRLFFGFLIIVAMLILAVLWLWKKQPVETPLAASIETNTASSTVAAPSAPAAVPIHTNASSAQAVTNTPTPSQAKGEQMKKGLAELNDVPIDFYGRLEDQFGSAVFGAHITANVRIYNGVQSTVEHLATVSDGNGMFQIHGGKGESLGIMPKKEGYVLATTSTYFKYSYMYADHFTSDPNNPTVIRMWKLQGAEPLVSIDKTYKLRYTAAPLNFDLVAGKIVPVGGDLRITVNRPDGIISEQHPQNWSIDLEVVNGGFIETSPTESAIAYAAPEDGYQPNGTFGNNNGPDVIDETFSVQSRNGQVFSKVHLLFRVNNTPDGFMYVTFNGVANTNGSRNWEAIAPQ